MFKIIVVVICVLIIVTHFIIGFKNVKKLEEICTCEIEATVQNIKKYNYKIFKFYSVNFSFLFNEKSYNLIKGIFKPIDKIKETNKLTIHINPNNPNECYLFTIKERCKR